MEKKGNRERLTRRRDYRPFWPTAASGRAD